MSELSATTNGWSELHAGVRAFVGRRINDPHAADDLTQDVMLKVQARLAEAASGADEKLDAWVFRVARNAVVDHYRTRRAGNAPIDDEELAAAEHEADPVAELSQCVRRMIGHLPPEYAEALRLADLEGLSQQEVAERAGLSLSGAKSRIQRARQKLAAMFLDCCTIERGRGGGLIDYQTTPRTQNYCGDSPPCANG